MPSTWLKDWLEQHSVPVAVQALSKRGVGNAQQAGDDIVGAVLETTEGHVVDALKESAAEAMVKADPNVEHVKSAHLEFQPGDEAFVKARCLRYVGKM